MSDERHGDLRVAALAEGRRGLVTTGELLGAGLGRGAIAHRVARGRLHRMHRGVYLVGHPVPPPLAREAAALLAHGHDAVLSHRAAAALWGLLENDQTDDVDVTVAGRRPRAQPGVRLHRVRSLDRKEVRTREGLKVTAPTRTLLDLAGAVPTRELERAVSEAQVQRLVSRSGLAALAGRQGAPKLRALLAEPALTRSEAEVRFLALMRKAGLPPTRTNGRIGAYEVDFLWLPEKLVVEVDGFAYHGGRAAFERDRTRDAELTAGGHRVIRVSWRELTEHREAVIARVARALAAAARTPT